MSYPVFRLSLYYSVVDINLPVDSFSVSDLPVGSLLVNVEQLHPLAARANQIGALSSPERLTTLCQKLWEESYLAAVGGETRITPKGVNLLPSRLQQREQCDAAIDHLLQEFQTQLQLPSFLGVDRFLHRGLNRSQPARLLISANDPRLYQLPWHQWSLLADYPLLEVAFTSPQSDRTSLAAGVDPTWPSDRPRRILSVLGRDDGINVQIDQDIAQTLPNLEVTPLRVTSVLDLCDRLSSESFDGLIFSGHGSTVKGEGWLDLSAELRLKGSQFWPALEGAVQRGLKLVVFNSCEGLGLIPSLEKAGLPAAVLMGHRVPDRVAQEFLRHFLGGLNDGDSPAIALRHARQVLLTLEAEFPCASWLPLLYQHSCLPLPSSAPSSDYAPTVAPSPAPIAPPVAAAVSDWTGRLRQFGRKEQAISAGVLAAVLLLNTGWSMASASVAQQLKTAGIARYHQNDLQGSKDLLQWAFKLRPDASDIAYTLGNLYEWGFNQPAQAIDYYRYGADRGNLYAAAQLTYLQLQYNRVPAPQLIAILDRLLKAYEADPQRYREAGGPLYRSFGWALLKQGRIAEAEETLRQAIDRFQQLPPERRVNLHVHCLRAQALDQLQRPNEAIAEWKIVRDGAKLRYRVALEQACVAQAIDRLDLPLAGLR